MFKRRDVWSALDVVGKVIVFLVTLRAGWFPAESLALAALQAALLFSILRGLGTLYEDQRERGLVVRAMMGAGAFAPKHLTQEELEEHDEPPTRREDSFL